MRDIHTDLTQIEGTPGSRADIVVWDGELRLPGVRASVRMAGPDDSLMTRAGSTSILLLVNVIPGGSAGMAAYLLGLAPWVVVTAGSAVFIACLVFTAIIVKKPPTPAVLTPIPARPAVAAKRVLQLQPPNKKRQAKKKRRS